MSHCQRCGGDVVSLPNRFQLHAHDYAESTGALFDGRLCPGCWDEFVEFMHGGGVV